MPAAARSTHAALLLCTRGAWSGDTSTTSAPAKSSLRYGDSRLRFASRVSVDPNFIALPRGETRESWRQRLVFDWTCVRGSRVYARVREHRQRGDGAGWSYACRGGPASSGGREGERRKEQAGPRGCQPEALALEIAKRTATVKPP